MAPLRKLTLKIGSGATPRGGSNSYGESGIPFIRSQNIYNLEFDNRGIVYLNQEQAEKLNNVKVLKDDVLLNITGDSVARCTKVPKAFIGSRVNQHVSIIRTKQEELNPDFLMYYLNSPYMQRYMLSLAQSGGTRAALTKGMIESFEVPLPSLQEQKAIANILLTYDEKIDTNNEIIEKLEEMAQALFKHWFIDFEFPNQNGEPYKTNGGEMVNSELGMIPKGWEVASLKELVEISSKSVKPHEYPNRLYEHYSIPAYDDNKEPEYQEGKEIKSNKYVVNNEVVLVSKLNPSTKRIWKPLTKSNDAICSTEFIVYVPKLDKTLSYVYEYLNNDRFQNLLISNATGSTGSRQRVRPKETLKYKIISPKLNLIQKYSELVSSIHSQIATKKIQNQKLRDLRDVLLPKLMSGEIRVPFNEEMLEEV